jgi:hypothetical protein
MRLARKEAEMRKVWVIAALVVLATAFGIGSADATSLRILSGTATFSDSGTAQLSGAPGCFVTDSVDGTFSGQLIAKPVTTPVESGTFHLEACGQLGFPGVVETGHVAVTTLVGAVTATENGSTNFVTGEIIETWTVTGGSGAYLNATGTIAVHGQGVFTSPLTFTQSGTLTFNLTR